MVEAANVVGDADDAAEVNHPAGSGQRAPGPSQGDDESVVMATRGGS